MSFVKQLVSKEKRRYVGHGFNLDLTYITPRVVAMGYPSESIEGVYRNHRDDVLRFFEQFHSGHYKLYNLCSERSYDAAFFHGRVERYPFDDHNAPPLAMLLPFCKDVDEYLREAPENVTAIHCKAGKGRTGVCICAYLVYANICRSAQEAMDFYAVARTKNGKGLTIPSQRRFVRYFEATLRNGPPSFTPLVLTRIRLSHVPPMTLSGGCNLIFTVSSFSGPLFVSKENLGVLKLEKGDTVDIAVHVPVVDDIKVEFAHKGLKAAKMFHFWFHTSFVAQHRLVLSKANSDIDGKILKDKKHSTFPADFTVELLFVDSDAADTRTVINPLKRASQKHLDTGSDAAAASSGSPASTEAKIALAAPS